MEKTKENKAVAYTIIVILLAIILILLFGLTYIICNKDAVESSSEKTVTSDSKSKINLIDNEFNISEGLGTVFSLPYKIDYSKSENVGNVSNFYGFYEYKGNNKGKLIIEEKEVETNKTIKMVCACNLYSGSYWDGEKMIEDVTSKLYILFEDGTMGVITSDDIRNNNYKITMLPNYTNIDFFIEMRGTESGLGDMLYAVDYNGKIQGVDWITEGA